MDVYYKWQLSFNKHTCEWLDLKSCLMVEAGSGEWEHEENSVFCIFFFHNNILNDSAEPEIPDKFNYPGIPPNDFCDSLRYRRMRWIKTNTFNKGPIVLDIVRDKGDGFWRQVTPFEFEILQDKPLHCTDIQLGPNLVNTILKYDTEDNYRVFEIWWQCIDNDIEFIQGPIYKGNVNEPGDEKWTWDNLIRKSDLLGTYFVTKWTASTPGFGTAPVTTIEEDLRNTLVDICTVMDEDGFEGLNKIVDEGTETFNTTTEGFVTYRVLYDCSTGEFETPEVIGLSNPEDANLRNADQWVFFDSFLDRDIPKCVFYYVENSLTTISELKQLQKFNAPSIKNISLVNCPCSGSVNNIDIINSINDMTFIISGVIGESSEVNGDYLLIKEESNVWVSDEADTDIRVTYNEASNRFSLSVQLIYDINFKFTIRENINNEQVFISDAGVSFSDAVRFTDAEGPGTCSANLEGFVPVGDDIDLSSSSSESSSSSDSVGLSSSSSSSDSSSSSSG